MDYALSLLVRLELYLLLALSLNLLVGYAGLVSLCHAAFYGVGAYGTGLLMLRAGLPFALALPLAVLATMLLGALVALPSLRLHDDYFIVATLAFQNIVYRLLYNWDNVTGGARGLSGVPRIEFLGAPLPGESLGFALLCTGVTVVVVMLFRRLQQSPFGRLLRAVRDDEQAVAALGRSVAACKVKAFLIGSAVAAVAGALLCGLMDTLDPGEFTIAQSVTVLTALIVGGSGNLAGPLVGAALVVLLPEPLNFVGGGSAALVGEVRQVVFGLLLIVLLRFRPQGVAGVYRFE